MATERNSFHFFMFYKSLSDCILLNNYLIYLGLISQCIVKVLVTKKLNSQRHYFVFSMSGYT